MIVRNYQQLQSLLSWLDKQSIIAYDLETAPKELDKPEQAVKPRKGQVIGIALSNGSESFYIVHQHLDFETKQFVQYLSLSSIKPVLEKLKSKKLVTFNGSFDVRFTRHQLSSDLAPALWSEVQLARHSADENMDPWQGLKALAVSLFGNDAGNEQQDLNEAIIANGGQSGHVWMGPLELVSRYACKDVELTLKVNDYFLNSIEQQGLSEFYFNEEVMPLYKNVTIDLEDNGVKLDMPLLLQTQDEISADIAKLEVEIRKQIAPLLVDFEKWYLERTVEVKRTGGFAQEVCKFYNAELPITKGGNYSFAAKALEKMPDSLCKRFLLGEERLPDDIVLQIQKRIVDSDNSFNLMSKSHWKVLFFTTLKEEPLSRTDVNKDPQLDDTFLESVQHKYSFVPYLLDYNKLNKIKSTYLDRFINEAEDEIWYPRFLQHSTTTGRFSGNAQQLPRQKEESELSPLALHYTNKIRSFIISNEGEVLIDADYSSLEIVVFADDAGDEALLDIIRHDLDPYSKGAIDAFGLNQYSADKKAENFLKTHKPEIRQATKEWFLGFRYGMGDFKLSKILGISQPEAKKILQSYFKAYPKLASRMEELKEQAKSQGFVKSKAGRIRHLPDVYKLHSTWGSVLGDSLKLWEKFNESPSKYKQMKYLSGKYLGDLRNCLNFPIQSMAASIVNRASIAIAKEFKARNVNAKILLNVHDELLCSCKEEDAQLVSEIMQRNMEQTTKLSVPLRAIPQIGKRYSDVK
jgi:DNA polymerase I-like protein with 3'-5' exonuclease and polymerase domains